MRDPASHRPAWRSIWTLLFLVIFLGGFLGLVRWGLLTQMMAHSERSARKLAGEIVKEMAEGKPLQESVYRTFVALEPRTGYIAVANYRSGYRSGVINSISLYQGAQDVAKFLEKFGNAETLGRLIRPDTGFAQEYLDVVSVVFVPGKGSLDRTPVGTLKIGYVIPGYPYGRGYYRLWWLAEVILGGIFLLLSVVVLVRGLRNSAAEEESVIHAVPDPDDDLGLLDEDDEEETTVELEDDDGTWKRLFDGRSLDHWRTKGSWKVLNGDLLADPWGASAVTTRFGRPHTYTFRAFGQKVAGPDGFVLLFVCEKHYLAWILGGWQNSRAEVGGYETTRIQHQLDSHRWYKIEIKVKEDVVEGSLDDQMVWSLKRSEITESSPNVGFEKGVGVATWSTMVKFKSLELLED